MSKTLVRPPFILAHPGDQSGCGYYRIVKPTEALTTNGYATARNELAFIPDPILKAIAPDVVVWQRQAELAQIDAIRRYRELLPEAFFVYEVDDALSSVPVASYHQPFMSPTIDQRMPIAAALCDAITVTTEGLKEHMEKLVPGVPVRIAPNLLSKNDLARADAVRATHTGQHDTFRVGWGGGIGHAGDLALITDAMAELGDEVHWVFIGFKPENIPYGTSYEYRDAVPPERYIEALAALDVDVIVAPLEENHFNFCKSNLRLIEAGACHFPVIASPFGPYLTKRPPVEYADDAFDWIRAIRKMASLSPAGRKQKAQELRNWVERNYVFENQLVERMQAWLPHDVCPFVPKIAKGRGVEIARTREQLVEACNTSSFDVVYVRDGVQGEIPLLGKASKQVSDGIATVTVVSNDGGMAGYPSTNQFMPVGVDVAEVLHEITAEIGGTAEIQCASGPVIVLSREVLSRMGPPEFERWTHPEAALFEWSAAAARSGFKNIVDLSTYVRVDAPVRIPSDELQGLSYRCSARWPLKPVEERPFLKHSELLEVRFHRAKFRQMQPQNPTDYQMWAKRCDTMGAQAMEACLAWHETTTKPAIDVVIYGDVPLTNADLGDRSPGRWKLFFPKNSQPAQTSMAHAVQYIDDNPDAMAFYGDHDFAVNGQRVAHDFKPNFDLHLLLGRDYVSQVFVCRSDLVDFLTTDRIASLPAPCQLYALALDLAVTDLARDRGLLKHIPRIMAHLAPPDPTVIARFAAINAATIGAVSPGQGWAFTAKPHKDLKTCVDIRYSSPMKPKVSIIIPTKNNLEMIVPCIATLLRSTAYPNYEVLIIDNGSTNVEVLDYYDKLTDPRIRVYAHDVPFNWSAINNFAVTLTDSPLLCFLNDDTRILESHWLDEMVGASNMPLVGAVGARLSFPHNFVQHIGIVSSGGNSGHIHLGLPLHVAGYNMLAALGHEATAVTGACMLVKRKNFDRVGGFNEGLASNFNDVAFCLELRKRGLINVVPPAAHVQHVTSASRRLDGGPEQIAEAERAIAYMRANYPDPDPYWNPNLFFATNPLGTQAAGTDMNMLNWPGDPNPWEAKEFERVMVFGDINIAASEVRDKHAVYQVLLQGNSALIVDPPLPNVQPFDLRDPDTALPLIEELGIQKIIIGTLEYGSTLLLAFASRLGVPVEYRPRTAEAACPRRSLCGPTGPCDGAWKQPTDCQTCVDINGSPNGYVSIEAWRADWRRFIERGNVTTQLGFLENPAYGEALGGVYGDNSLADFSAP